MEAFVISAGQSVVELLRAVVEFVETVWAVVNRTARCRRSLLSWYRVVANRHWSGRSESPRPCWLDHAPHGTAVCGASEVRSGTLPM
jgi:hypothetical protein